MACESLPPLVLMATRAPARIILLHRGGTATSAMRLDMDRTPRRRRGVRSSAPRWNRLGNAGLERVTLNRRCMPCETQEAPIGQEGRGMTAAGIEMACASC